MWGFANLQNCHLAVNLNSASLQTQEREAVVVPLPVSMLISHINLLRVLNHHWHTVLNPSITS
jgi:hypothetical protein